MSISTILGGSALVMILSMFGYMGCQQNNLNALNKQLGQVEHSQATCLTAMKLRNEVAKQAIDSGNKRSQAILAQKVNTSGVGSKLMNELEKGTLSK